MAEDIKRRRIGCCEVRWNIRRKLASVGERQLWDETTSGGGSTGEKVEPRAGLEPRDLPITNRNEHFCTRLRRIARSCRTLALGAYGHRRALHHVAQKCTTL